MGHIHAAAMAEYAKDAAETDKPWERWEFCHMRGEYQSLHGHPEWVGDNEYRRKPKRAQPARRTTPRLARRLRNLPAPHRAGQPESTDVDGAARNYWILLRVFD